MKKLYTIGMGLSFAFMASTAFAQVDKIPGDNNLVTKMTTGEDGVAVKANDNIRKDDPVIFWSEDFSNGLAGQGDNGAWTTGQDNGNLWFQTFPAGQPNAYDRTQPLDNPAYNNTLPNFFGTQTVLASPTANNGVMMLDADRYNSDATDPDDIGGSHTLPNTILSTLISPTIDLSDAGDNLVLTFSQKLRQCCTGYSATAELSTDNGSTWIPYDVFTPYGTGNTVIEVNVSINISDAIQTASTDLTQCKVRFFWAGSATVYYWFIDDVAISELPANDLSIGKTYYNDFDLLNYGFNNGPTTAVEYYKEFEYNNQPDYLARPFTFGGIISNLGAEAQTGVTLHVDATLPDATVITDFAVSDPINMESGAVDTVFIADVTPDPAITGMYTFNYRVTQDQDDAVPGNNMGLAQTATITTDNDNGGYALASNDARTTGNSAYTTSGQDRIWGVPFVFPEATDGNPKYITHVEAVLYYNAGFAETLAGEIIYFNVRKGSVLEEDETLPETMTTVVFDENNPLEYDASELEHEIQEDEIWDTDQTGGPVWLSFQLPTPVMVDANTVYQAEFRVPAAGDNIVFSTIALNQEQYAAVTYDFAQAAWLYLGNSATQLYNSLAIRFRTAADPDAVEEVTSENGMQLMQNYPNPFTSTTMIQYRIEKSSQASLEVRDITGKLVFNKDLGMAVGATAYTYELQKGSLSPGMYTYSIVTAENTITRKLTVQ